MLYKAIILATDAHYGQVDKQFEPYVYHCLAVMNKFDDELDRTVAVLHDIVEDTWVTFHDLARMFPLDVVHAVEYLTRRKAYGETYREYIIRLAENPIARRIKIADLYHNLSRLDSLRAFEANKLRDRYDRALTYLFDKEKE